MKINSFIIPKVLFLCFFLSYIVLSSNIYAQVVQWGVQGEGGVNPNYIEARGITGDASGNSYVAGYFSGTVSFEETLITSAGDNDIFFAKYSPDGGLLWVKTVGGVLGEQPWSIRSDNSGNIILVGHFRGTVSFDSYTVTSNGEQDIFVAKYSAGGNCLWVKSAGGLGQDIPYAVTLDINNNIYITGAFYSSITFGAVLLTGSNDYNVFVVKYDENGSVLWGIKAEGNTVGLSINTDRFGNVFVSGVFNGTANFNLFSLTSMGENDRFIAKVDPSGTYLWVKQIGTINNDIALNKGFVVDENGYSYVLGNFMGNILLGSINLTSNGLEDIYLAKINPDGDYNWGKSYGGEYEDYGGGLALDNENKLYLTSSFRSEIVLDTITLSATWRKYFVAKIGTDGITQWALTGDDNGGHNIGFINYSAGSVFIAGQITSSFTFGSVVFAESGIYMIKIDNSELNTITPFGGEEWQINTPHNITWNSIDDGNLKLELSTNGGGSWFVLQNNLDADVGNYTFTIPPLPSSSNCFFRLTSLKYGNVSISGQLTITSQSVPNLTITVPNSTLMWRTGSIHDIEWTVNNIVNEVNLLYSTDKGVTWNQIVSNFDAALQNFAWTIPESTSSLCRIKIMDAANPTIYDFNDENFSIQNMNITSPVLGDVWKAGTRMSVSWETLSGLQVNVYYSTNNGSSWTIIGSTAASGFSSWLVPDVTSENCKIKVVASTDASFFNESNTFSIWQPIYSTQTPNIGAIVQAFGQTNITFTAFILVTDAITTGFFPFEAPAPGELPLGIVSSAEYYWNIASSSISFFDGKISAPLSSLRGVTDPSKLRWLKRTSSGAPWTDIGGEVVDGYLRSTVTFDSFSEFTIGSTDAANPLPVELKSFTATPQQNQVLLQWETVTEVNCYGFDIERAIQNQKNPMWVKVGFVSGSGNSNSAKQYSYIDKPIEKAHDYLYRLKQIDHDGNYSFYGEVSVTLIPSKFNLYNNYPNPFNPSTIIKFSLPEKTNVELIIFNMLGETISTLKKEVLDAGYYEVEFNASHLSSGVYFYILKTEKNTAVKKMLLIK